MKQLAIKPVIHAFDTCKEFCEAFEIGEGDLIITNEYIFNPLFTDLGIKADVMYQEKYGTGEPSDEIIKDKELVLVPTTCGTGSEVTNLSI